jgi:hypothetical protein
LNVKGNIGPENFRRKRMRQSARKQVEEKRGDGEPGGVFDDILVE